MLTTILTMPQMAILPTVTRDNGERNKVVAAGAGFCAFSFTVASTFTPQLTAIFGGNYVPLMFIYKKIIETQRVITSTFSMVFSISWIWANVLCICLLHNVLHG